MDGNTGSVASGRTDGTWQEAGGGRGREAAVVIFTEKGRDEVMRRIKRENDQVHKWIDSAVQIGGGDDTRAPRIILYAKKSHLASQREKIRALINMGSGRPNTRFRLEGEAERKRTHP